VAVEMAEAGGVSAILGLDEIHPPLITFDS
jgi:hypothetical protein